eukprot:TRINITY_DN23519_c1_g5_i1.p1 TRINITY_DN23519_c1_g5~~TRINITY_DN23519_c1_g5_i1.p1  ORF type:complete len:423 (+),score=25.42 TRINITY_DN23519_c1_g5_i1:53-1321(+)
MATPRLPLQIAFLLLALLVEVFVLWQTEAFGLLHGDNTVTLVGQISAPIGAFIGNLSYFLIAGVAILLVKLWLQEPGRLPTALEVKALRADASVGLTETAALAALMTVYAEAFATTETESLDLATNPPAPGMPDVTMGGKLKWCRTCRVWRPERCSHCSHCDHCCLGFDHHCEGLGICIGQRNRKSFVFFGMLASLTSFQTGVWSVLFVATRFWTAELTPLGSPWPKVDVASLNEWRAWFGYVFVGFGCVRLMIIGMQYVARFVESLQFVLPIIRAIICPALITSVSFLGLVFLGLHMLFSGTLHFDIILGLYSVVFSVSAFGVVGAMTFLQCLDILRGTTMKGDANLRRMGLVPKWEIRLENFTEFMKAPTPVSLVVAFKSLQTTKTRVGQPSGGNVQMTPTLHGRASAHSAYDSLPTSGP